VDRPGTTPVDRLGRPVRDLRVSVTDRCNFRCTYCMPRDVFGADHAFLPRSEILSFEEIARLVGVFAYLGVSKVRLTGGEPLLRKDLEKLVRFVAQTPGIDDVALTTNGSLLASRADSLRSAGLGRVTVSLDSVDPAVFAVLGDTKIPLSRVLDGIAAAKAAGLTPVKLNAVIQRGINDEGLLDLVDYAREHGHVLRLIEYMDVGHTNAWQRREVVPATEIIDRIAAVHPLEPAPPGRYGEVARRWTYADGAGEIGVITSVTQPFCTDCTRARLTATGELFTCLFASKGQDLRALLRSDASDDDLRDAVTAVWTRRTDRYSELRDRTATTPVPDRAEMSYLGG
jgi:cyclic pyranopterin phosphate synthase